MSTGLFIHRGVGQGRAFQKARKKQPEALRRLAIVETTQRRQAAASARLDEFAEALAEGFTLGEAANLVDVSLRVGQRYYREICARLGAERCA